MPSGKRLRYRIDLRLDADEFEHVLGMSRRHNMPLAWVAEILISKGLDSVTNSELEERLSDMAEERKVSLNCWSGYGPTAKEESVNGGAIRI